MTKTAVIGTTSWGTTLATILAKTSEVLLCCRTEEEAITLNKERQNSRFLPGISFPDELTATSSYKDALMNIDMLVIAVPSNTFRENVISVIPYLPNQCVILSATKGLEVTSNQRMTEILDDELPLTLKDKLAVLSGPNLAKEISLDMPASTIVASRNKEVALRIQGLFNSETFRVYTSDDVVGVELGGSLKNIIAIGAGISDGLGYGNNSKSAFINRGLVEITRLGVALGAKHLTFSGLAGLGDLVATCYSPLSRNRYFGEKIGKGDSAVKILSSMENVVEGVNATASAVNLAYNLGVSMPVTNSINQILLGNITPTEAVSELMARMPSEEWLGIG